MNDGIRYAHLLTLAIGFGISFLADATVFRRLNTPLSKGFISTLHWCHLLVTYALIGMWLSGATLIYLRTGFIWENFSPKLIAKIIVVSVLTLNSILISRYAMTTLARNIGQVPLRLPVKELLPMALISGASTTSWLFAMALGSSVFLKNASAELYLVLIPASYGAGAIISLFGLAVLCVRKTAGEHHTA